MNTTESATILARSYWIGMETDFSYFYSRYRYIIIIDIDNCDPITKNFISVLLANANAFYMTTDEITPWGLVSRNRIYNLDWIIEAINQAKEESNDNDNDDEDSDEG